MKKIAINPFAKDDCNKLRDTEMADFILNVLSGTYRQQIEFLNVIRYIGNEVKIPMFVWGRKKLTLLYAVTLN